MTNQADTLQPIMKIRMVKYSNLAHQTVKTEKLESYTKVRYLIYII